MILGFPRAKQGLCHTKHGGAGEVFLVMLILLLLQNDLYYSIVKNIFIQENPEVFF